LGTIAVLLGTIADLFGIVDDFSGTVDDCLKQVTTFGILNLEFGIFLLSRRLMNRLADTQVGATPAYVAVHRAINLCIRGPRSLFQQRGRVHDLTGLAIAALGYIHFHPGFL
jgi:hypothetical protein